MLLKYISIIVITKEFYEFASISATAYDNKQFASFRDYILKYSGHIYVNKLIADVDEQCTEKVNLIDTN